MTCTRCGDPLGRGGMGTICRTCVDDMTDEQLSAYLRSLQAEETTGAKDGHR